MTENTDKNWQQKVTEKRNPETGDPGQADISPEEYFAAVQMQMELEAAAEAAIADDSKKLFEHLFGKDDELDALIAESQKEMDIIFAEAKAE